VKSQTLPHCTTSNYRVTTSYLLFYEEYIICVITAMLIVNFVKVFSLSLVILVNFDMQ